jgi:hypothetical protein
MSKLQSTSKRWGVGDSNVVCLDGTFPYPRDSNTDAGELKGLLYDSDGGGDMGGDDEQSTREEDDDGMEDTKKSFDNVAIPEPNNQILKSQAVAITEARLRQRQWTDTNPGWTLAKKDSYEPNSGIPSTAPQLPAQKNSCEKHTLKRKQPSTAPKTAPNNLTPKCTQQMKKPRPKKKVTSDRNQRKALNVKLKRDALTTDAKKEYDRKKNEKLKMYRAKAKKKKEEKKKAEANGAR